MMEVQDQTDLKSDINIMDNMEDSQILKMFAGSTVFLTGGTGYLGKLLVEKLLRCCPKIKKIYLLARPKKNKDIMIRLQEQFDDVLYDKLRKQSPNFMEKLGIIPGDIAHPNLGISEEDRNNISNEVEFIFHGAATVRFDEALKTAVAINVRGTREVLLLARSCTKLRALVHISTAYSNCPLSEIEEKIYERKLSGDKLIDLAENIDEETLNRITPGLLGDFPNTYAYTKSAGEDIVQKYSEGLPVAVFRPSIVVATAQEPISGWIDNIYGPTGAIVGAGVGLIHVVLCDVKNVVDLVPGDYVVNGCIATAWKTARDYPGNHEEDPVENLPLTYNYVSSEQNPLTWKSLMKYLEIHGLEVPTIRAIWYYAVVITANPFLYNLYFFFLHWVPAYIIDFILMIIGKKPMLLKIYKKVMKLNAVQAYFIKRQWIMHNGNTRKLFNEMNETDKQIFNFDIGSLDWSEYFKTYIVGLRIYLVKDPLDTLPQSRKRYFKLKLLHYFLVSLICLGLLKLVWFAVKLFV